jgi:hypothetical protein
MRCVAEVLLPAYRAALNRAVDEAVDHLPAGKLRMAVWRLRRRLDTGDVASRIQRLRRLALLGEARGWIDPREAIIIQRLASRVAFYERRTAGYLAGAE